MYLELLPAHTSPEDESDTALDSAACAAAEEVGPIDKVASYL